MKKCSSWKHILLTASLTALLFASTAYAGVVNEKKTIKSIDLSLDSDIMEGTRNNTVTVTPNSDLYTVKEIEVTNQPEGNWKAGTSPRVKITLESTSDKYYFSYRSLNSDGITLSGIPAVYGNAEREGDNSTLIVYVRLADLTDAETPYMVSWNEDGTGTWRCGSSEVSSYEVKLASGSQNVLLPVSCAEKGFDFSSYLQDGNSYKFYVRSIYGDDHSEWIASDVFTK